MIQEVLEHLLPRPGMTAFDGTAGEGGHGRELLKRILPGGQLIFVDVDAESLRNLRERFRVFDKSILYFNANFSDVEDVVCRAGVKGLDMALLDIGVSSVQLDTPARGFSIQASGPLDMRMDRGSELTAAMIVNQWHEKKLAEVFWVYGEERHARRIARRIVESRRRARIISTEDLAQIVVRSLPARAKSGRWRIHPATRVFQALRIVVNDELDNLKKFCDKIFNVLRPGGRVAIISFHSLEDRIVKRAFREAASAGMARLITKRPIRASVDEIRDNPRCRSAKLRVAERSLN